MEWIKNNIVSLLIAGYLALGSLYFNDKLKEVERVNEKLDAIKSQYFERYDEILHDQDKRILILETKNNER